MSPSAPRLPYRFGDFELDLAAYELRRLGRRVKLERQPMDLLILLLQNHRQLVSRDDIVDRLWGKDVFVDVETGVNTAIRKIRQALRDSPDAPVFVETVPGRGYRFIAPLSVVAEEVASDPPSPTLPVAPSPSESGRWVRLAIGLVVVAFAVGLLAWARLSGGASGSRVTLAVLPFENPGHDPEQEYLAAGLTQETSASLAQVDPDRLSVKGRTVRYKGTDKTAIDIGRELAVDYLVESSVRAEGGRVRVTATLIRVRDQEHVWSQSFEREATSLLGLQQELSTAIAEQIRVRLSPERTRRLGRRQAKSAEAYDAYLRARYLEKRRAPDTNVQAIEEYERAVALDPDYALAWAGLAMTYATGTLNSDFRPADVARLAREAATHAIRANPDLAESQFVVAYVNWLLDWDWAAAHEGLRRAVVLDPSEAAAQRALGHALSQSGRHDLAEVSMRRARELEPLEPLGHAVSAQVAFQARDYPAAVEHARRAILIDSEFWIGYMQLGQAYIEIGEPALALEALSDAARFSGGNSKALSSRGYLLAKAGRVTEARETLKVLEDAATRRYVPPAAIALVHAGLSDRDAMFVALERAYAERDIHLIFLPVDPKWDPYRADPRFVSLLARCGFAS